MLRVVREPLRKLGPEERFFGPIQLSLKHNREPEFLLYGICAAMIAEIPGDFQSKRIKKIITKGGVRKLISELNVDIPEKLIEKIESLLPKVKASFGNRL